MKNMNTGKRVSFGNAGSLVETLIIEDIPVLTRETEGEIIRNINNNTIHCHGNSTKIPSDEVKITVTDTSEHPTSTEEESTVIHPSSDPTDSPPGHWPLKRSQSVDSRDNPFLPGGDLSKEAEEILSRATIIRDKFILKDNERNQEQISLSSPTKPNPEEPKQEVESNALPVEETVSAEVANMAESVPNARVKENGQITESEDSLTPGSVKMELMEENKDKKKQKKCCTIM